MKNAGLIPAAAILLAGGIMTTACQLAAQEETGRYDSLTVAQQAADVEEWKLFMSISDANIRNSDMRIATLKGQKKEVAQAANALYGRRLDTLEQQSRLLRTKIETYQKKQGNWGTFRNEFNMDMDALKQALKAFPTKNLN